jgi:hypothetical protein
MVEQVKHSVAKISVQVCYALPDSSFLVQLEVAAGTTIAQAIEAVVCSARTRDRPCAQPAWLVWQAQTGRHEYFVMATVSRSTGHCRPISMESRRRRARCTKAAAGK